MTFLWKSNRKFTVKGRLGQELCSEEGMDSKMRRLCVGRGQRNQFRSCNERPTWGKWTGGREKSKNSQWAVKNKRHKGRSKVQKMTKSSGPAELRSSGSSSEQLTSGLSTVHVTQAVSWISLLFCRHTAYETRQTAVLCHCWLTPKIRMNTSSKVRYMNKPFLGANLICSLLIGSWPLRRKRQYGG